MGPAMDQEIIWDLFTNVLEAAKVLGIEDDFVARVRSARERLLGPQIGSDGRLLEWSQEFKEAEPGHRHMSHLFALHPGRQISMTDTPELAAAARKSLEYRLAHGGGHTGWSRAWIINFWARLRDGGQSARERRRPAGEIDASEPLRHASALPDRRQLRRHGGHRRDAPAKPRGRDSPAARPAERMAERQRQRPAGPRRLRGGHDLDGGKLARSDDPKHAGPAMHQYGTATRPCRSTLPRARPSGSTGNSLRTEAFANTEPDRLSHVSQTSA